MTPCQLWARCVVKNWSFRFPCSQTLVRALGIRTPTGNSKKKEERRRGRKGETQNNCWYSLTLSFKPLLPKLRVGGIILYRFKVKNFLYCKGGYLCTSNGQKSVPMKMKYCTYFKQMQELIVNSSSTVGEQRWEDLKKESSGISGTSSRLPRAW